MPTKSKLLREFVIARILTGQVAMETFAASSVFRRRLRRASRRFRRTTGGTSAMRDESDFLERLRSGDDIAFRELIRKHQTSLVGVAQTFVRNRATAEEVVQDTWLAVVEGLSSFEGRSSLKNWIFAILANKARTRAVRDSRVVAAGSLAGESDDDETIVDLSRFDAAGKWSDPPHSWDEVTPERIVAGKQIWAHVRDAIDELPEAQKSVLILRDVEQMEASEVRDILGVSDANQRVLLHRARAQIRQFAEKLMAADVR